MNRGCRIALVRGGGAQEGAQRVKRAIITLAGSLAVAAATAALAHTGLGRRLEWIMYDAALRLLPPPPWQAGRLPVKIIAIDDASIEALGRWSWPRNYHAALLQVLSHPAFRPQAIGYDIAFLKPDSDNPRADADFVEMVRTNGTVVLGYHFGDGDEAETGDDLSARALAVRCPRVDELPAAPPARWPWPALREVAGLGFINMPRDGDGVLRRAPLVMNDRGRAVPSLALATVLRALSMTPAEAVVEPGRSCRFAPPGAEPVIVDIDRQARTVVDIPRSQDMDMVSFCEVLRWAQSAGDPDHHARLAAFKGAVVFVGMEYALLSDSMATPRQAVFPGVCVHAAVAHHMLSGRRLRECPGWVNLLLVWGVSLGGAALAAWPRLRLGVPGLVLLMGGAWGAALLGLRGGLVTWTFAPPVAGAASFAALMTHRQLFTERGRRHVRRLFSQYLSPEAVREIVDRAEHLSLSGRRMEAVVLFCDIRGFTALTERLGAQATVAILNEYFDLTTEIIQRHGGAVNKFVGDQVFATFGVPVSHGDDALRAVRAAIETQQCLARRRAQWRQEGKPELMIGIGISRGEVVAGSLGSERHRDYTVIGDAVNLGARLEELTKSLQEPLLVCRSVWQEVHTQVTGRPMGETAIRGRAGRLEVYAIDVPTDGAGPA